MRLIRLRVAGFRGFNDEQVVDFDAQLVIYSGSNGSGKTAIGEALEWLLYGKTLKRIRGDEISKREYAGSYRNTHFRSPNNPFVEAEITDISTKRRLIRRELKDDESSTLTIDKKPAKDLRAFGVITLYDRPLILQHTLQDFIFMKPKTRYEVLSGMLGLDGLIEFRSCVETAKNEFAKRLPARAIDAQNRSSLLLQSFKGEPLLGPVATAVEQGNLNEAQKHLVQVALGRVAPGTPESDLLPALRAAQAAKERSQLDWGRFSLAPLPTPGAHPGLAQLQALERHRDDFHAEIEKAVQLVAASPQPTVTVPRRQFFQLGLELTNPENPAQCPFCLQDTLTPKRLAQLRTAIEVTPTARGRLAAAQTAVSSLQRSLEQQWSEVAKLLPRLPSEDETISIRELSRDTGNVAEGFLSSCQSVEQKIPAVTASKQVVDQAIAAVLAALRGNRLPDKEVPNLGQALREYSDQVKSLPAVTNAYAATYAALDPYIKTKLASAQEVRFLTALIDGLEHWSDFQVTQHVRVLQDRLQDLIRQTRAFIETKQKHILATRDKEIKNWYAILNPGAQVGYDGIAPATDNLELRAKTFTKGMMAAPNLSASQLNCVGIAIYLACATRAGSPFKFLLFDDPIQSMDDDHTEAFKKQVIKKLLDQGFQTIILTHMDNFAGEIERLHKPHNPLAYRIEEYTLSGPVISWKGSEIGGLLKEARRNKDSTNDGFRMQAVLALRHFVERFVKDLFVAETGNPVSRKYESEPWPRLRDLLRQCKRFDSKDEPVLEDTHQFTSPFLHTDGKLPQKVPSSAQLNPHYEAMKDLLDKYSSNLGIA